MEEVFYKLQGKGHNTTEYLIKWMKEAKIINAMKTGAEKKAHVYFKDVPDPENVQLDKFKEIVTKYASEQKKSIDELMSSLLNQAPALLKMTENDVPGGGRDRTRDITTQKYYAEGSFKSLRGSHDEFDSSGSSDISEFSSDYKNH